MTPTAQELQQLRKLIIASIADRGRQREHTLSAKLIDLLFDTYAKNPQAICHPGKIRKELWPDDSLEGSLSRIRQAIARAKEQLAKFFENDGRRYSYRITIQDRAYRLLILPNEFHGEIPAKRLRSSRSTNFGLLCARSDWFNSELIAGALAGAESAGFQLQLAYSDREIGGEQHQIADLKRRCAGIIAVPILDDYAQGAADLTSHFSNLERERYPLVFVDHPAPDCLGPVVCSSNIEGGRLAAEFLCSEAECEHVYVVWTPGSHASKERVQGFEKFVHEMPPRKRPQVTTKPAVMPGEGGGGEFIERLLQTFSERRKPEEVGVFATDDGLAFGMRTTLQFLAPRPTQEAFTILGFGGQPTGFSLPPAVTIREDHYRIGREAVGVLVKLIENKRHYGHRPSADLSVRIPVDIHLQIPDSILCHDEAEGRLSPLMIGGPQNTKVSPPDPASTAERLAPFSQRRLRR